MQCSRDTAFSTTTSYLKRKESKHINYQHLVQLKQTKPSPHPPANMRDEVLRTFIRNNQRRIFLTLAAVLLAYPFFFTLTRSTLGGIDHDYDAAQYDATHLVSIKESALGATGNVFAGKKIRQYRRSRQLVSQSPLRVPTALFPNLDVDRCEQWAVVTTIFKPQLAFEKILDLSSKWCLFVVGDEITPDVEYEKFAEDHELVYYLSGNISEEVLGIKQIHVNDAL